MFEGQRRRACQLPPQENRRRDRALLLVRSQTHSLTPSNDALRQDLLAIVRAAIRAADAGELVKRAISADVGWRHGTPTWLIAVGKAAPAMAEAAIALLGSAIRGGIVIAPAAPPMPHPLRALTGEHPQPGAGSESAGREALSMARAIPPDDRFLVLLSGGASALMAAPAPGIGLDAKRRATATLLRAGANIHALNTVRKHLSAIKGGWLAVSSAAPCRTLAVSDVVGDDLSVIGSGPTVADGSTFSEAYEVLRQFGGLSQYPEAVVAHVEAGMRGGRSETPKPGDPRLVGSTAAVIGGRFDAMRGAETEASARGFHTEVLERAVVGEARLMGRQHIEDVLVRAGSLPRPLCVISSGETTVTVKGQGHGGRNQELALVAADVLAKTGQTVALASIGTDGVDGPTDAAGAIADFTTLERARAAGLPPIETYLDANDSYPFFAAIGDLVETGPTGTNVGDVQVLLIL